MERKELHPLPEEIARLLRPLEKSECQVLHLRFGLDRGRPRTFEEVGQHLGVTASVQDIEDAAIEKLKRPGRLSFGVSEAPVRPLEG